MKQTKQNLFCKPFSKHIQNFALFSILEYIFPTQHLKFRFLPNLQMLEPMKRIRVFEAGKTGVRQLLLSIEKLVKITHLEVSGVYPQRNIIHHFRKI